MVFIELLKIVRIMSKIATKSSPNRKFCQSAKIPITGGPIKKPKYPNVVTIDKPMPGGRVLSFPA